MTTILIKPILTEKSMQDAARSRFTFSVAIEANKAQVAQAVAAAFGVKVVNVKTMTVKGKTKRAGKLRLEVAASSWKKAIVELAKGQKIDLFDIAETPPATK